MANKNVTHSAPDFKAISDLFQNNRISYHPEDGDAVDMRLTVEHVYQGGIGYVPSYHIEVEGYGRLVPSRFYELLEANVIRCTPGELFPALRLVS